jgi:hypothetical protein
MLLFLGITTIYQWFVLSWIKPFSCEKGIDQQWDQIGLRGISLLIFLIQAGVVVGVNPDG